MTLMDSESAGAAEVTVDALRKAAEKPVLNTKLFKDPIIIESLELLRKGKEHFVRVRSKDGAEGIAADNGRMDVLYPIFNHLVAPYFVGKDARELEEHLFGVYREKDNYKFQGLALWVPVAMVEFAILDMLGRIGNQPIGELLGGVVHNEMPFYVASGRRDTTPQQEVDYLKSLIDKTGARQSNIALAGGMNRNIDAMPGRTENLIPLSRKALGDKITILTDANSSYDPPKAIEIGHMLESIGCIHYEEPCPFDDFEATKRVKDALKIPIALGEQESSHWRYQEMIRRPRGRRGAARFVLLRRPDSLHPRGPHGGAVQFADHVASVRWLRLCLFAAFLLLVCKNLSPWQEYKQGTETYGKWFDPPLRTSDSTINVPKGPGVGIADPNGLLQGATAVTSDLPWRKSLFSGLIDSEKGRCFFSKKWFLVGRAN